VSRLWKRDRSAVDETDHITGIINHFIELTDGEVITIRKQLTINSSVLEIAEKIQDYLNSRSVCGTATMQSDVPSQIVIDSPTNGTMVIVRSDDHQYGEYNVPSDYYEDKDLLSIDAVLTTAIGMFSVWIAGSRPMVKDLVKFLHVTFQEKRYAKIKWWYDNGRGPDTHNTYLDAPTTTLRPEFYPYFSMSPQQLISDYLKSEASVLLLAGTPGTGKTTLLRHMIHDNALTASVLYDEKLMEKDAIFQKFLFGKEDMLIIEDADIILKGRESDHNKLMSRFLNVSDGLIKLPNKKLVFTTNLNEFDGVDPALMRPGRCFAIVKTLPLTYEQALKAAHAAGLPKPADNRLYTVAELFNQRGGDYTPNKIGFV
jgi:hypothetical protein